MLKKVIKFLKNNYLYLLLTSLLIIAFIVRIYNLDRLLGFYYDQGRDALVIWDLWHKGKFFLVGPTTGLAGILRGPYYYYLIAPFYLIGAGNPVFPAVFLILTTIIAIAFVYYLGKEFQSPAAGIIGVILASFSFQIVMSARWLSNPTPMLLLSMLLVWSMYKVMQGKKWAWPVIAVISGLSFFNFGSSGELFYLFSIAIFFVWQWKNKPDLKYFLISVFLFTLTFAPLLVFNIKHDGILQKGISDHVVGEKSFGIPTLSFVGERTKFYYDVFSTKIFHFRGTREINLLIILGIIFLFFIPKFLKNQKIKILLLLLLLPIIGLYFYQGNGGVLYDYYMTGYYLIFILLVAIVLGSIWKFKIGKIFIIYFLFVFLTNNAEFLKLKLLDKADSPNSLSLINQEQAVDWVYKDSKDIPFNVDVYVPPVIPYAYDYLFLWRGQQFSKQPSTERVKLLYTLYENDYPVRLDPWLARQNTIGKVIQTTSFGGITVQKRERLNNR